MKKMIFPILMLFLLAACEKDTLAPVAKTELTAEFRAKKGKIDVCHYSEDDGSWHMINISENAWPAHEAHGDVRLDDQDDDGFVPDNECGFGTMGDCDDSNAAVNPGAEEANETACSNGIDDDCDGYIDEADPDCVNVLEVTVNPGSGTYTLYVHPYDQRTGGTPTPGGVKWSGLEVDIPGLGNKGYNAALVDFNGFGNTPTIVTVLDNLEGPDYAAKVCAELEYGGYTDWYLPAVGELRAIYDQLGNTAELRAQNNFNGNVYWSSTERHDRNAWVVTFRTESNHHSYSKYQAWVSCRCVRR